MNFYLKLESIDRDVFFSLQTVGSTIAMYMISPTLTTVLVGCLPLVFLIGSLLGSQLRRLSYRAHEAVSRTCSISLLGLHAIERLAFNEV